jgi:hypothetical protein
VTYGEKYYEIARERSSGHALLRFLSSKRTLRRIGGTLSFENHLLLSVR